MIRCLYRLKTTRHSFNPPLSTSPVLLYCSFSITVSRNRAGRVFGLAAVILHSFDDHVTFNLIVPPKASRHSRFRWEKWNANLCRRRTNFVADWNNCLMPRDTDKRLLGLWGLELSVEGRGESDRVTHFTVKYIHCEICNSRGSAPLKVRNRIKVMLPL